MAAYAGSTMAVVEALVQVRFIPLQLWLMVFLFHCGWWYQVGYSQYQGSPEVVTFLRITSAGRGLKPRGWVSYSLHFGGQRHIVHMKVNKHLLARHMPVFTYTDQGALLEDQPFVQSDCFYHGYVEGVPDSLIALTSCFGGFRGMLQVHEIAYEIKPKDHSNTLEHLVYRMESEETSPPMSCGLTDEEIERQLRSPQSENSILMQSAYEAWWTHHRFVEMAVVVDHNRYLHSGNNVSNVYTDVCIVMNGIDFFLNSIDIELILMGIEIWTQQNPIPIQDINDLLKQFCKWKQYALASHLQHDVIHLFVKQDYGATLGVSNTASVCISDTNCGVDSFMDDKMQDFAFIVSHMLGHNLGMSHDNVFCSCGHIGCVMFPSKVIATRFSNCSYASFWDYVLRTTCLRDSPEKEKIFKHARCGNNLAEEGEECDCGSLKSCEEDPCCHSNCTLTSGSECAFGLCCHDCKIMGSGLVCRKNENECDLPEWCNGTSFHCPDDVYVQDGTPCAGGDGYCYEKQCSSRDEQCRKIFGNGAKSANDRCYMEMNSRGDRFGHCGLKTHYLKCNLQDTLCGRIQCDNVTKVPTLRDHNTVHWTQFDGTFCWGTDYHFGMTMPDIGDVKDGTQCGEEHICIKKKCVHISHLARNCSPKLCNMKGICNNRHHCHCNYMWDPPNCYRRGCGGSVDSGPPPEKFNIFKLFLLILLLIWLLVCSCCLFFMVKDFLKYSKAKKSQKSVKGKQGIQASLKKPSSKSSLHSVKSGTKLPKVEASHSHPSVQQHQKPHVQPHERREDTHDTKSVGKPAAHPAKEDHKPKPPSSQSQIRSQSQAAPQKRKSIK